MLNHLRKKEYLKVMNWFIHGMDIEVKKMVKF